MKLETKIKIILGVMLAVIFFSIVFYLNSLGNDYSENGNSSISSSEQDSLSSSNSSSSQNVNSEEELVKYGTSEDVDNIAHTAKEDAQSIDTDKTNEAIEFITINYGNYFKDKETMERTMYYGFLLEYAYESNDIMSDYYKLGRDTEQCIKYVYRGAESVEHDSVQANLYQIQKSLIKING